MRRTGCGTRAALRVVRTRMRSRAPPQPPTTMITKFIPLAVPTVVISLGAVAPLVAQEQSSQPSPAEQLAKAQIAARIAAQPAPAVAEPFQNVRELVALVSPLSEDEKAKGVVRFQMVPEGVRILADFDGLEPGSKHGIHLHQFGDLTAKGALSAGDHYNPEGKPHGLPDSEDRHAGDFGNLTADSKGRASIDLVVKNLSLAGPKNPILGRTLIIHAKQDDGSQPSGNAGDRIAAGVVGISMTNPAEQPAGERTSIESAPESPEE